MLTMLKDIQLTFDGNWADTFILIILLPFLGFMDLSTRYVFWLLDKLEG
jgi:hypothetical protein